MKTYRYEVSVLATQEVWVDVELEDDADPWDYDLRELREIASEYARDLADWDIDSDVEVLDVQVKA